MRESGVFSKEVYMLQGERIHLRRMEERDLEKKTEWINDNDISRTLMFDWPLSVSETRE